MTDGQFQIDQPRSGIENMALDQSMLEATARDAIPRLRFYRWIEPTFSLGYFQKFSDFEEFLAKFRVEVACDDDAQQIEISEKDTRQETSYLSNRRRFEVVRRATGGGAIIHDFDWTYCVAIPAKVLDSNRSLGASESLYNCVHQAVVHWLRNLGASASVWPEGQPLPHACTPCDFLCFRRRHAGDVLIGPHKVMGSAQRRHAGALLQHGSLLLAHNPLAPDVLGIEDLLDSGQRLSLDGFCQSIRLGLTERFHIDFRNQPSLNPLVEIEGSIKVRLESPEWVARI